MIIRRAKPQDIDQILGLLSQVLKTHATIRPDIFNDGTTKYRKEELEVMVADDMNPIYVATECEEVLGYVFCQIRIDKHPHLLKRNKALYIDDFCVDEKQRRKHVGLTLFEYVKNEAIRLGCDEITLNSWVGNTPAEKFYESLGFKPRSIIMEYIIK